MSAHKRDIEARAQGLLDATGNAEEQRGIVTMARMLLGSAFMVACDRDIFLASRALIEASDSPGFRRGVGLLTQALTELPVIVEPRAASLVVIETPRGAEPALLAEARGGAPVVLLNQRGEVRP